MRSCLLVYVLGSSLLVHIYLFKALQNKLKYDPLLRRPENVKNAELTGHFHLPPLFSGGSCYYRCLLVFQVYNKRKQ